MRKLALYCLLALLLVGLVGCGKDVDLTETVDEVDVDYLTRQIPRAIKQSLEGVVCNF